MATILETRDYLIEHLYNNWTDTEVAWPNKTYNPSSDTAFIKPFFAGGNSKDLEIGINGADQNSFTFFIDIFVPLNTGNRQGLIYAENLRNLFLNFDKKDINLTAPIITELGENSGFYQIRFSTYIILIYYP